MLVIYDGVVDCIEQLVLAVNGVKNALYPGIAVSTAYDPDICNANDPDPASDNAEFWNIFVAPVLDTVSVGCNTWVTWETLADVAIIAIAPLVNLYPSSYNNRVTVIVLPFLK